MKIALILWGILTAMLFILRDISNSKMKYEKSKITCEPYAISFGVLFFIILIAYLF